LIYRFVERLYVPTDYFAARDFNAFLQKQGKDFEPCAAPNGGTAKRSRNSRADKGRHR
jgi:hypothetical protein